MDRSRLRTRAGAACLLAGASAALSAEPARGASASIDVRARIADFCSAAWTARGAPDAEGGVKGVVSFLCLDRDGFIVHAANAGAAEMVLVIGGRAFRLAPGAERAILSARRAAKGAWAARLDAADPAAAAAALRLRTERR